MRRKVKCCTLLRIHFKTANKKIQFFSRYQSYTRRYLKNPRSSGDENALSALYAFASGGQRFERKSMKKLKTKSKKKKLNDKYLLAILMPFAVYK